MAQAARRLDETGAAANLRRSQVAARRQEDQPQKRGHVLQFPGSRTPGTSQLREAEVYNFPSSPEQRAMLESQNREKWMRDKIQARQSHLDFIRQPQAYKELSREMREEPEMMAANQEYRSQVASIVTQDRLTSSAFRERLQTMRRISDAQRQLTDKIKRIRETIQKLKDGKDFAFTAYEVGSLAESEGAMAEMVNVSGIFISLYRGMKTVIMPDAALSTEPDAGQFFKGVLSFAEPTVFRTSKPTGIIGFQHALYGYFWLFALLGMFLGILVCVVAALMILGNIADILSFATSAITGSSGSAATSVAP